MSQSIRKAHAGKSGRAVAAILLLGFAHFAWAKEAKGPAAQGEYAALAQARKVGVVRCAPLLANLLRLSVAGGHTALSTWHKDAPNTRMFSAIDLSSGTKDRPRNLLGVVAAAPESGGRCDGVNVTLEVTAASCEKIAGDLAAHKAPEPEIRGGERLYAPNDAGQRVVLLPDTAKGCVIVSTGTYYGK